MFSRLDIYTLTKDTISSKKNKVMVLETFNRVSPLAVKNIYDSLRGSSEGRLRSYDVFTLVAIKTGTGTGNKWVV